LNMVSTSLECYGKIRGANFNVRVHWQTKVCTPVAETSTS
jgi:hypothetical protein